jgi:hypothetical protein
MSGLYKIVLNAECKGQNIQNYFAYRVGVGIDPQLVPFAGASVLAEEFRQEVLPALKDVMHESVMIQSLDVYVYNSAFSLIFSAPYREDVNEPGELAGSLISPAQYVTFKANLEPMLITEAVIAPKRGWSSIGPMVEEWFTDGKINDTLWNMVDQPFVTLCDRLASNLESIDPPAIFYPVRLKQNQVLGVNTVVGYADIQSWAPDRRLKIRKSRQYDR